MSWDKKFEGKVVFAKVPLYLSTAVVFQNVKRTLHAKTVADLTIGMTLGTVRSYEYPASLDALPDKGVALEASDSETQNLNKLASGRLTALVAMIDDLKSAEYLIAEAGVEGRVEVTFVVGSQGSFVGFSTVNPEGVIAKNAFDRGMAIIKKNGTLERILARWKKRL